MKRVLIVGNSHCAALIAGWSQIAGDYGDRVTVQVFASWARIFRALSFRGSRFGLFDTGDIPAEKQSAFAAMNQCDAVDLADFDAILLVGMAGQDTDLIALARRFDIDGISDETRDVPRDAPRAERLSHPVFAAWVDEQVRRDPLTALLSSPWATQPSGRVTLLRRPRARETLFSADDEASARIYGACHDAMDRVLVPRALAAGLRDLPQPPGTLTDAGLTRQSFAAGAPMLAQGKTYGATDLYHMNADFGALCLRSYLDTIGCDVANDDQRLNTGNDNRRD